VATGLAFGLPLLIGLVPISLSTPGRHTVAVVHCNGSSTDSPTSLRSPDRPWFRDAMRPTAFAAALMTVLLAACTGDAQEPAAEPTPTEMSSLDTAISLTSSGQRLLASSEFSRVAPRVDVTAAADPTTGKVTGTVLARLPVGRDAAVINFRYFAGLDSFQAEPTVGPVTVDGAAAEASRDAALITVQLPQGHGPEVVVIVPFGYTLPEAKQPGALDALKGTLEPADIGLLARHTDHLSLGHWFPIWVPPGMRADAEPQGYGDISNFPAADISLRLSVPKGWTVVDGGIRVDETTEGGETTVTSYGTGMRDLSVAVVRDYVSRMRQVGDVTVRAWGPTDSEGELDGVADETAAAIATLSETFGDYPWKEFDVVSTPLGGGVSGMEWPGATWIESSTFSGGIPGLGGGLGELLGKALEGMEGMEGMEGVEGSEDVSAMLSAARPWTIAHEVGHSWWTILVGNDSIAAPVVDEPLAQYSACLVVRSSGDDAADVCESQIVSGYSGMLALGGEDGPADRATDEFSSAAQYGGLVYGKAAWFYVTLDQEFGAERVREALRAIVDRHAFEVIGSADVRAVLVDTLGPRAGQLFDRWMHESHGEQDMPETAALGGLSDLDLGDLDLGDLGDLGDLDPEMLQDLLEELN
jgi:hypothetical protein